MASRKIELTLVFTPPGDGDIDYIPSVMDELPNLGDRFTYMDQRWQVRSIDAVDLEQFGTMTYVYLTHEDPEPRA